jgi:coenzyme Q-binding protein COQ10
MNPQFQAKCCLQHFSHMFKPCNRAFFTKPIVYTESKILGYSPVQLYSIVANINAYKLFLPYCIDSKIISTNPTIATLKVGFKDLFEENYSCSVNFLPNQRIEATTRDSKVFKTLQNKWSFLPVNQKVAPHPLLTKYKETSDPMDFPSTRIDFFVQFEFQNLVYQQASDLFLDQNVKKIMAAFQQRAFQLYGPPTRPIK